MQWLKKQRTNNNQQTITHYLQKQIANGEENNITMI